MWNDEDNNPYGASFERRDSTASSTANPNSPGSSKSFHQISPHKYKMWEATSIEELNDADGGWVTIDTHGFAGPRTPSTISDHHPETEGESRPEPYGNDGSDIGSDEDYAGAAKAAPRRKKGGYDSRIEQILYENPELPILIVDAGKSNESGGKYIVYTIRTGVRLVVLCMKMSTNITGRIWKFDDDILSLRRFAMRSHGYTLR